MAFVSRSERKMMLVDSNTVGPGAYLAHTESHASVSFAPFSSTTERDITKIFCKSHVPGPGSYSSIEAQLVTQALDHWGHPKYSSSFASQNSRFNTLKPETSPGPGSYLVPNHWEKPKISPKTSAGINWTRIPSAPSIPANHQSHGYDQTTLGELIRQEPKEIIHAGNKVDSVGPGQYESLPKKNILGPKWHKSNSSREIYKACTTGPGLGPGSYTETKIKVAPMYKFKESAAFAKATTREKSQESNLPGPGSYSTEKISAFNKKKLPSNLQNFGSSTTRFQIKQQEITVGPGHYGNSANYFSKINIGSKVPFSSSNTRFHYKYTTTPGPGTYDNNEESDVLGKKILYTQGVFGSNQARFIGQADNETPGPGHYKPENLKKSESHGSLKKPNAVFVSKVKREEKKINIGNPAPGSYETTSAFNQTKPPIIPMNPILSKITNFQSDNNVGFASSTDRFQNEFVKVNDVPGPGSYDIKNENKALNAIVSHSNRFKGLTTKNLPGPGAYYEENDEAWNKKSYNVLFSEVL